MSRLLLIRHGQASLGAADYDVLSPVGGEQATALGAHLARMLDPPQAIYAGPRKRQRDTASLLVAAAREAGAAYPDPVELPAFDEYPALPLMKEALPALCERNPDMRALTEAWLAAERGSPEHRKAFERAFRAAMRSWHDGQVDHPDVEPFPAFYARVERGLWDLVGRHDPRDTLLLVTSAGPVGVAAALALGQAPWAGLTNSFVVNNASITELSCRPGSLQLRSFNALPHLTDRRLVTTR